MDGDELVFLYQLKEGICQSSYAANIATLAGLPTSIVQRGVEVNTHTHRSTAVYVSRSMLTWSVRVRVFDQVSELFRTGRLIKSVDKASSDEQTNRFVKLQLHRMAKKTHRRETFDMKQRCCMCVTDRCRSLVEAFLSLDLEDKDLDLQHFMKEELLPSAGELLNRR